MTEKYLIIIDLDGTIMLDFGHYDIETIDYLRKLKEQGHKIIIATGRPRRSSYFVYQAIGLDTPIINYNGALIDNPNDDLFPKTDLRIDRFKLKDILSYLGSDLINVFCEIHDDIYVMDYNKEIHDYLHVDGGILHNGDINENLPDDPNGALLFVKENAVSRLQTYVKEHYSDELFSRYWGVNKDHIVEIYSIETNKGAGLKEAITYYHIDPKNTIAIGDGHNDIEMFQEAHYSIAMANSHPELFKHATKVIGRFDEKGVLHFLQDFFENK